MTSPSSLEYPKAGWSISVFRKPLGETEERWERVVNGATDLNWVEKMWDHTKHVADKNGWKIRMSFVEIVEVDHKNA